MEEEEEEEEESAIHSEKGALGGQWDSNRSLELLTTNSGF
jgi:hypothetical protein